MQRKSKVSLKTNDYEIHDDKTIDFVNNKINYIDDKDTSVLLDLSDKLLIRDNSSMYLEYDFSHEKGYILIKEMNKELNIEIKVEKFIVEETKVEIVYKIENDSYTYIIDME